jgi:hypothetical protein
MFGIYFEFIFVAEAYVTVLYGKLLRKWLSSGINLLKPSGNFTYHQV